LRRAKEAFVSNRPEISQNAEPEVTRLLVAWSRGDAQAAEQLTEVVYAQVRAIAGKHLRQFEGEVTLAPTELANELFLRLLSRDIDWRDRRHFFGVVVAAMRNLLIDVARARGSEKRGGGQIHVTLSSAEDHVSETSEPELLNGALDALREIDPRKCEVIELTYFLGLKREEIAETLDVSLATVDRELRFARAWLKERLQA
jgi:RNA polymerase sigma factor (TIGR02999 family)